MEVPAIKTVSSRLPWENKTDDDNIVLTLNYRNKLARSMGKTGVVVNPITIAFGNGGLNQFGEPNPPTQSSTGIANELLRKNLENTTFPESNIALFSGTLQNDELNNQVINEFAVFDEDGEAVFVRTFPNKSKYEGATFIFEIYVVF